MKKYFYLMSFAFLLFSLTGCQPTMKKQVNVYNIIPMPNRMSPQEGRFKLTDKVNVITAGCSPEVQQIADSLVARIQEATGIALTVTQKEHASAPAIRFATAEGMPKEGYKLSITPNEIVLTASQANGFFYGVQTIYQLMPAQIYSKEKVKHVDWSLPAVEIEDAPRFRYRGLMLDVCRHLHQQVISINSLICWLCIK